MDMLKWTVLEIIFPLYSYQVSDNFKPFPFPFPFPEKDVTSVNRVAHGAPARS